MTTRIRVDGELLEEIEVNNGLRQGCSMAPTLFNLYACVVGERWLSRVAKMEDVGSYLRYKFDQQLFRRSPEMPVKIPSKNAGLQTMQPC